MQRVSGCRNRANDETRQHPTQFFLFVLFVSQSRFFFHFPRGNGAPFFFPRFALERFFSFAQSLAFYIVQVLSLRAIGREFCVSRESFPQRCKGDDVCLGARDDRRWRRPARRDSGGGLESVVVLLLPRRFRCFNSDAEEPRRRPPHDDGLWCASRCGETKTVRRFTSHVFVLVVYSPLDTTNDDDDCETPPKAICSPGVFCVLDAPSRVVRSDVSRSPPRAATSSTSVDTGASSSSRLIQSKMSSSSVLVE